jgi:hypothetical protein
MPSTRSLVVKLHSDFPDIHFAAGDDFRWSPHEHTIFYRDTADTASLIHELAHAILGHSTYTKDIDLLKMERDAWDYAATTLAKRYKLTIDENTVQDALDTYRNWLHTRSTCPDCQATGLQTAAYLYSCLACKATWRVNEARSCALRRYTLSSH